MRSIALCLATLGLLLGNSQRLLAEPLFERDILPLLQRNCLGCHGGLRQQGGLDMRTIPALLRGGENGPAVKAGDAAGSLLWKKVASDEMPEGEKKLTPAEKESLKTWIAAGMPLVVQRQTDDDPGLSPGKHSPAEVSAAIDKHLEKSLQAAKIQPAAVADDAEFLRRVYLDLTGRTPSAVAAAEFLDSTASDKRAQLIDTLLASPQFGEQFGRTWREWVAPPELPSDANGGKQPHRETQELGKWFGACFAAGESWDKIVRDLITAEGELKNNPQIIFFGLAGEGGKTTPGGSARLIASLFMGVQLQCAECHDDPYRDWSQQDHWALAAFFRKANGDFNKVSESGTDKDKKNDSPAGANPGQIAIPKTAFKNTGTMVQAAFLKGETFTPANDAPLRPKLAEWLTSKENPFFAQAFANRLWFYFFNRGIVHPIDDFRALNPPSHPGLMKLLAQEFTASDFDIKHLIRCLCNSTAYQRTSRVAPRSDEGTVAAQTIAFGRMPLRLMTADMLFDSLKLAYGDPKLDLRAIDPRDGNTNGESAPVADAYLEFLRRFGTNEEDAADFTHGIPQMLAMINHPRLLGTSKSLDEFLTKTKPTPTREQAMDWLYLTTLSRRPTATELTEAVAYHEKVADPAQGWSGLLWMLVNRSEYLFIR